MVIKYLRPYCVYCHEEFLSPEELLCHKEERKKNNKCEKEDYDDERRKLSNTRK